MWLRFLPRSWGCAVLQKGLHRQCLQPCSLSPCAARGCSHCSLTVLAVPGSPALLQQILRAAWHCSAGPAEPRGWTGCISAAPGSAHPLCLIWGGSGLLVLPDTLCPLLLLGWPLSWLLGAVSGILRAASQGSSHGGAPGLLPEHPASCEHRATPQPAAAHSHFFVSGCLSLSLHSFSIFLSPSLPFLTLFARVTNFFCLFFRYQ